MTSRWGDNRPLVLAIALLLGLTFLAAAPSHEGHDTPPHNRPGPATDTLYFRSFHVDRAPQELQAGEMDIYFFNLKTAAARELRDAPGVELYQAPATSLSLILNPAPALEGELNPFSLKKVRLAMQYLVDRDFVAGEIYQGLGLPMTTHVSPLDFDYLTIYDLVREQGFQYDPDFAAQLIEEAMTEAGAESVDGIWNYGGRPIRIKFIIRVEDERRDLGDLVRSRLERVGFQVEPAYQQFAPAVLTVYSSDPRLLQWHIYTEGWGRGSPQKYDFATINQMAAPWMGNMPGWQEVGFWQFENEEIDTLGQRLFTGDFSSVEERNQLYSDMSSLALEDSVRIWVATVMNTFPATDRLEGVTEDLVAGPKGPWTLREAYVPGQDVITVGNLWVWTERTTWNPVGGFGDVYSVDIWNNLHDPPLRNHPVTGIPMSFRASYAVDTAGPGGKLDVPLDAVLWDAQADRWTRVGAGAQATSKVTFDYSKYFNSVWHHGVPITMADVVYSLQQGFEISFDREKTNIEFALGVTARPYLDTFRGFRVLDDRRLEVYVDFWHFVDDYIASFASPASLSMPWEILAVMDSLVFEQRRAAYSNTAAGRFQVPWISLAIKNDATLVRRALRQFLEESFVPEGVFAIGGRSLVDEEEAARRYQAALDWFEAYKMLVISNGPYYLARYDPPAQFAELKAFRDPSYPFQPGDWYFGAPDLVLFSTVERPPLEIGSAMEVQVALEGPGELGLRYQVVDPATGQVLQAAEAQRRSGTEFSVTLEADFTAGLRPGLYQLYLAGFSDEVARLAERRLDLEAFPEGATPQPSPAAGEPRATPTPAPSGPGCSLPAQRKAPGEAAYLLGAVGLAAVLRRRL